MVQPSPSRPRRSARVIPVVAACLAVLAGMALPGAVAAAGNAPLLDGRSRTPVSAPVVTVTVTALYYGRATEPDGTVSPASPAPCEDRKRSLPSLDKRIWWDVTVRWAFRAASTPRSVARRATLKALKRSVANITGAHNDCGRADRVSASAVYTGTTSLRPAPTERGTCAPRDFVNVVGFGQLQDGIAALTCVWSVDHRIVEADIKLDKDARWATSLAGCDGQSMVEAVATHEFGHVYGLTHVPEATHGRLTMSERLDGHCQINEATLGIGDLLSLEELY